MEMVTPTEPGTSQRGRMGDAEGNGTGDGACSSYGDGLSGNSTGNGYSPSEGASPSNEERGAPLSYGDGNED